MSDHISAMFGAKRDNPMRMRCLQPLTGMDQLAHLPAGPKVWHGIGRMADRCDNKHKLVQCELQMKAHHGRCYVLWEFLACFTQRMAVNLPSCFAPLPCATGGAGKQSGLGNRLLTAAACRVGI